MNKIEKKYNIRVFITMSIYCLLVYASIHSLKSIGSDWPLLIRALIALSPVVPVAFFCKAYVTYINECDELIRRIELEAIGLSTVAVGLLYLSLGFLGRSHIIDLDGITVAVWVFPLLCLFYGASKFIASRRYR